MNNYEEKSEIEKMYWKAKVKLIQEDENGASCINPFTTNKQIQLIERIIFTQSFQRCFALFLGYNPEFADNLAQIVNVIWDDFTDSMKADIQKILQEVRE